MKARIAGEKRKRKEGYDWGEQLATERREAPADDDGSDDDDGKRGATWKMLKNQGLKAHKKVRVRKQDLFSFCVVFFFFFLSCLSDNIILFFFPLLFFLSSSSSSSSSFQRVDRNPRVKKRRQYDKAIKNRKGAVRTLRNEAGRYQGETTGIRTTITRSRRLG